MAVYDYELSTTTTLTNLEAFATPINPPRSRFYEAGTFVDRLDGNVAGSGFPKVIWQFDVLTQAMVTALRTICPGYSASVYIKTRKPDGTFGTYTAVMVWPQAQMDARNFRGRYLGLEIQFRRLEVYTP
jgi:hypothetical protein